jgi:hypothetical protein
MNKTFSYQLNQWIPKKTMNQFNKFSSCLQSLNLLLTRVNLTTSKIYQRLFWDLDELMEGLE